MPVDMDTTEIFNVVIKFNSEVPIGDILGGVDMALDLIAEYNIKDL